MGQNAGKNIGLGAGSPVIRLWLHYLVTLKLSTDVLLFPHPRTDVKVKGDNGQKCFIKYTQILGDKVFSLCENCEN